MQLELLECSCCGIPVKSGECHVLYVGLGNCQLICKTCQDKPFKEVMDKLKNGKVYKVSEIKEE